MMSKTNTINKNHQIHFQILFSIFIHFPCASHLSLNIITWSIPINIAATMAIQIQSFIKNGSGTIPLYHPKYQIATHEKNINQVRM
jgi:hypothetical protein